MMDNVNVDLEKRDLSGFYNSSNQRGSSATSSLLSKFNPLASTATDNSTDLDTCNSLVETPRTKQRSLKSIFKIAEGPEDIAQSSQRR